MTTETMSRSEELAESLAEILADETKRHEEKYAEALSERLDSVSEENAGNPDLAVFLREAEAEFWKDLETELRDAHREARSDWLDSLDAEDRGAILVDEEAFEDGLRHAMEDQ